MGGANSSSMHIGNGSNNVILGRVTQDNNLRNNGTSGFARIGPNEFLDFELPQGKDMPMYVSMKSLDGKKVFCDNFSPPRGVSVYLTRMESVSLSKPQTPNESSVANDVTVLPENPQVVQENISGRHNSNRQRNVQTTIPAIESNWITGDGVQYSLRPDDGQISGTIVPYYGSSSSCQPAYGDCRE